MNVYSYDYNGYYTSTEVARISPLDGEILVPANATSVAPSSPGVNQIAQWNGTSWDLVAIPAYILLASDPDKDKIVVFFVNEEGKDATVIGYIVKKVCWDYENDEPLYNGESLPATIGYSLFSSFSEEGLLNEWDVPIKKVSGSSLVDRSEQIILTESNASALVRLRALREVKIQEVEWLRFRHKDQIDMGVSPTLTTQQYSELLIYIQALRDLPENTPDPKAPVWPAKPEWL